MPTIDLIDRGPAIGEVIEIVKGMIRAGAAQIVMGNQEFNALCFEEEDGRILDGRRIQWYRGVLAELARRSPMERDVLLLPLTNSSPQLPITVARPRPLG